MKILQTLIASLLILLPVLIPAQNVGIGTVLPNQKLSINGKLRVGNDATPPTTGTIRFNTSTLDFEGWTGNEWKSFTFNNSDISTGYMDPNGASGDNFGESVDIDFETAAAGVPGKNRVNIFARFGDCWGYNYEISNWQMLNNTVYDQFGKSVGLGGYVNNKFLAVGAPGYQGGGSASGGVGIYAVEKTTHSYKTTIIPSDNTTGDYFGWRVSVFLNDMAISAPYDDNSQNNEGSVYIYRYNTFGLPTFQQKITLPNPELNAEFGKEILLVDCCNLFVYTPRETVSGISRVGRVYHFKKNVTGFFVLNQIIDNPTPSYYTQFGRSLAYFNGTLMIGASDYDNTSATTYGAVYVYQINTSTNTFYNTQKLTVPPTSNNDNFGFAIAMYYGKMVVSAPGYDAKGRDAGALFYFEQDGTTWDYVKMLNISDNYRGAQIGQALATYNFEKRDFMMGSKWFNSSGSVHFLKAK